MRYCLAVTYLEKIQYFQKTLKLIDVSKGDIKRDGLYSIAIKQLDDILNNRVDLDMLGDPDYELRDLIMLIQFDLHDCKKEKKKQA